MRAMDTLKTDQPRWKRAVHAMEVNFSRWPKEFILECIQNPVPYPSQAFEVRKGGKFLGVFFIYCFEHWGRDNRKLSVWIDPGFANLTHDERGLYGSQVIRGLLLNRLVLENGTRVRVHRVTFPIATHRRPRHRRERDSRDAWRAGKRVLRRRYPTLIITEKRWRLNHDFMEAFIARP